MNEKGVMCWKATCRGKMGECGMKNVPEEVDLLYLRGKE
jgi:hypothetical protein